ncbi:MAG: arginine--tRNA ligase [Pseudomonadota bacterium]
MRELVKTLMESALQNARDAGALQLEESPGVVINRNRDRQHGDFACPLAMSLAKAARRKPRDIAAALVEHLPDSDLVERVEIAGPGFINVFLADAAYHQLVGQIRSEDTRYGRTETRADDTIQVEFVSANPTGPLHVGHGRGAAYGDAVASLLEAAGYNVQREYYVNDAGRQMDILTTSVWVRYVQQAGVDFPFPANGYQGDYIHAIAAEVLSAHGDALAPEASAIGDELPADEPDGGDKEAYIDALIARAQALLGEQRYRLVFDLTADTLVDDIRQDLEGFGVHHDRWFSERSLVTSAQLDRAVERLKTSGHIYETDGAWWFRSTDFGDEKDRVVIRDNGQSTYFASDIAYHMDKLERFRNVINVWGADHHGYIARVKGSLSALGEDAGRLRIQLVQFANLYSGGEKMQMSTRSGEYVTLRQLREDVGRDAARFYYVMRKNDQHLDFDLDLARSQTRDNPVYYVQYAHARIHSVFRRAAEAGVSLDGGTGSLARLVEPQERALMQLLERYPEAVMAAAEEAAPHQVAHYLRDVANGLHSWYDAHRMLVDEAELRLARLTLADAARVVLRNGLDLLGVSAPEAM